MTAVMWNRDRTWEVHALALVDATVVGEDCWIASVLIHAKSWIYNDIFIFFSATHAKWGINPGDFWLCNMNILDSSGLAEIQLGYSSAGRWLWSIVLSDSSINTHWCTACDTTDIENDYSYEVDSIQLNFFIGCIPGCIAGIGILCIFPCFTHSACLPDNIVLSKIKLLCVTTVRYLHQTNTIEFTIIVAIWWIKLHLLAPFWWKLAYLVMLFILQLAITASRACPLKNK